MKARRYRDFFGDRKCSSTLLNKCIATALYAPKPARTGIKAVGATQVERRAIREFAQGAGACSLFDREEPMAGRDRRRSASSEATGSMVVDIGGGTTEGRDPPEPAWFTSFFVRIGGDRFDAASSLITFVVTTWL